MEAESNDFSLAGAINQRLKIFEELAFLVISKGSEEHLTDRTIFCQLSPKNREYVSEIGCAPDETPMLSFMQDAHDWDAVRFNHETGHYQLGKLGHILINQVFERQIT